jgi:hypothetical protein
MRLQPLQSAADFSFEDYQERERVNRHLQKTWKRQDRAKRRKSVLFWCLYVIAIAGLIAFITWGVGGCKAKAPVNPAPSPSPAAADHSITFTWNQSFANNQPCSASLTESCISGFDEGYVSGTADIQLHSDAAGVCSGTTQPENCTSTFNGTLPIGNVTFYVTTTYVDQNGNALSVATPALSSPVAVGADPASNVAVKIND